MKSNLNNVPKRTAKYVIDASITGTKDLKEKIYEIIEKNSIILTSVTVKELIKLEKFSDCPGMDAKFILGLAAERESNFLNILINEEFDKPDNAIIAYCAENKEDVILLTSDREMTLNARMRGVKVEYIKQTPQFNISKNELGFKSNGYINKYYEKRGNTYGMKVNNYFQRPKYRNSVPNKLFSNQVQDKAITLKDIFVQNGKLDIICYQKYDKAVCVYSDGIFYQSGIKEIKIGDEILIAKRHDEEGYTTFSDFVITSLEDKRNAILKDSKRIYSDSNDIKIQDKRHLEFVKNFLN